MNLRLKYSTLGKICIIIALVVHTRYFYLIKIGFNRTLLMSYFAIASMLFSWIYLKKIKEVRLVLSFIGVWAVTLFYSLLNYNSSISEIYSEAVEYLAILLAIAVYAISKYEKSVDWIENIVILIGTAMASILTIQGLILTPNGITIIDIQYSMRLGGIRFVNSTESILFAAIFALARLLKNERKRGDVVRYGYILIVATIELLFVAKTRALIIMYFATIIIMLWNAKTTSSKKELFRKTVIAAMICVGVIWGLNTNIAKAYFNEYQASISTQYDTMSIRNEEAKYAIELLKTNLLTALAGTGFVSDTNTSLNYVGNTLKGLRTDIGVLGFINEFGIMGMVWILFVFIRATRTLLRNSRRKEKRTDYLGLYCLFVMGLPTLFLFNGERLIYFPIWLGIMMYYSCSDLTQEENGERN